MPRDHGVPSELRPDFAAKRGCGFRIAMHDVTGFGRTRRLSQPSNDFSLVGVHRKCRYVDDFGAHRNVAAQHLYGGCAFEQRPSARAQRLIANQNNRIVRIRQASREMVHHAPAGCHPGRRYDDQWSGDAIDRD